MSCPYSQSISFPFCLHSLAPSLLALTFFPSGHEAIAPPFWCLQVLDAALIPQAGFCLLERICLRQAWRYRPVIPHTQETETLSQNIQRVLRIEFSQWAQTGGREEEILARTSECLEDNLVRQKYWLLCVNPPEHSVYFTQTVLHSSIPVRSQHLEFHTKDSAYLLLAHCSHFRVITLRLYFSSAVLSGTFLLYQNLSVSHACLVSCSKLYNRTALSSKLYFAPI